ncbi:MAG TPA: isoleucine--tRNA ligase, partial [Planctomycetaceae bacterium]|nr:isoleucine--tRNA ligase [Planctomycetaceae bacterium]
DETRRRILIPLWNCYKFFVDYAVADGFAPSAELRACAATGVRSAAAIAGLTERPEIDRWILSNLQSLAAAGRRELADFNAPGFCAAAAEFIDDLSNWYIRRNRRRFWRARDAADGDKLAAYETLYEVLVVLCRLLAPCIPFLTERMYLNLVLGQNPEDVQGDSDLPGSVHLCDYPDADHALLDAALNQRMAAAQKVVRLGHKLREEHNLRVRQPLSELRFAAASSETAAAVETLADVIAEELNIQRVLRADNLDALVSYAYKPNLKTLGPKCGRLLNALKTSIPELGDGILAPLRRGQSVTIELQGSTIELLPEDVLISTMQAASWISADDAGIQVAISTVLTPELLREGMSRDFVRHVQQLRKDAGLNIQDRIRIFLSSDDPQVGTMIGEWGPWISAETLADSIELCATAAADARSVTAGESAVQLWIAANG